ncbi:MAG TPA: chromosomal replication initiator protein DnaA [Candidatus Andersenbacteria bacterium]|nr:chromosomal replication initiator protein DnaA [Candidatus Andersenbacteria bacterium]
MKDSQLWKVALDQLELRVSKGNFLTWFRNTNIKDRSEGLVIIETQNPFAYEWLSKKYQPLILEILQGIDSTISDVRFSVASKNTERRIAKKNLRIIAQKNTPKTSSSEATEQQPQSSTRQTPSPSSIPLNKKYTFETFVVGTSNEIAHAACRAVAEHPGETYNPLFIYGGVGLGKTHLLQAVGNAVIAANPGFTVMYVASEKFANEFVESLREGTIQQFKKRYRDVDMFIIDDVQFFAGKDKTQEELFYTFNTLHNQNKQIILSSDRPPSAIPALQERLSSRLAAGMIADVKRPDYETRLAILSEKRDLRGIDIDSDALSYIAKNIQSNVRELEGALNKVAGYYDLHHEKITLEYARRVLKDLIEKPQRKTVNADEIISAVSSYYNISSDELCGKSRKKEIVRPRQVAMYILRRESNMAFPSIGEHFSGRDHTTAMHACEKIEKLIDNDEELSQEISFLRERIYA